MAVDLNEFSRPLFKAVEQLWTNTALMPDQQPVLALIALLQMESKLEAVHAELAPKFRGRFNATPEDYRARGAVYLPESALFSRLIGLPETADLGVKLKGAVKGIAEANPDLATALPPFHGAGDIARVRAQ